MVSDGMIEEQASIPRQLLVLDQIQMTPETSSTHPPITIRVLDFQGAPLPNAKISLLTTSGYATSSSMYTNAQGEVEIYWNFGNQIGVQILKVIADLNGNILQRDIGVYLVQSTVSAIESTITGTTLIAADGYSLSTVTITLKTSSGIGIAGEIPTFTATDTDSKNIYTSCSPTDDGGVSSCSFSSRAAEVKTLQLETPVSLTGGTVEFIDPAPAYDIAFTTQPVAATTDDEFTTQPVIQALNQSGQANTTNSTSVIVLTPYDGLNCSGSVVPTGLGGFTSVILSNGTATFTNVVPKKTTIRSLLATTGSLSKCSNNFTVSPGAPNKIAISSGNGQKKQVTEVLDPFVVIVRDFNDNLVPYASVAWTQISGSGFLSAASSTTNSSGEATSTLTLSSTVENYVIEASILSGSVKDTFVADSTPGDPYDLISLNSDPLEGTVGATLVPMLRVKLVDEFNNPIPDMDIDWKILMGNGNFPPLLTQVTSLTDEDGEATTTLVLGTTAGLNEISATVSGFLITETFEATGVADAPDTISLSAGYIQSVNYGTNLSSAMEVLVQDQYLNPVEDAVINWTTTNSGTLTSTTNDTSATGLASNGILLSTTAGPFTVTATLANASASVPAYTFNYNATVPPPTNLAGVDGAGTVDLTWDAVTDAESYKIYTSTTQGGPYTEIATSVTNSYNSLAITGTTYIVIKAVQGTYQSTYSNEISAPTLSSWLTQIGINNSGGSSNITLSALGDETCLRSVKTVDAVYCAGYTTGSMGEMNGGGKDGIIIKYDINTGARLWIRQLGAITKHANGHNSGDEECTSVAVSNDGSVYCAGHTTGSMSEPNGGGKDAFVAKIANDGSLSWIVQLGQTTGNGFSKTNSSGDDSCNGVVEIDLDPNPAESMHVFCGGGTKSTVGGDEDAFILKISQSGSYVWVKQVGGTLANPNFNPQADYSKDESCRDLKASGTEIFCGGSTKGNLGTTVKSTTEFDIFSFSLNPDPLGESITWLHQIYSDDGDDYCLGLHYESNTQQLICGGKTNSDFAEINAGPIPGTTDAILVSFNNDPVNVTYYGKEMWKAQLGLATADNLNQPPNTPVPERYQGNDSCLSVTSDGGRIFCGGETQGYMFDASDGSSDAFIASFAIGGNLINDFSKQFTTTSGNESCPAIEFIPDPNPGSIMCLGSTTGDLDGVIESATPSMDIFKIVYEITATPTLVSPSIEEIDNLGIPDPEITLNKAALDDACKALIEDSTGNLYCAGHTYGNLGETNAGGADAFIMKLDKNGNSLWIRQLGEETLSDSMINGDGSGNDFCTSIALDSDENVYCAGYTSGNLKEINAGRNDIFFAKYSPAGFLLSLKHFGDNSLGAYDGSGDDKCHALTINDNDDIYCAGETYALGDTNAGGSDAMVMKTDSSGDIVWVNQIGGTTDLLGEGATAVVKTRDDAFYSIALDADENIYAAGGTLGSLFMNNLNSYSDAIIVKIDPDGLRTWGKQFGDTGDEECLGVTIDNNQSMGYCGGYTTSGLNGGLNGDEDAFVKSFNLTAVVVQPEWINQFGTTGAEYCRALAIDSGGNIYCGGETNGEFDELNGGGTDSFIAKMDSSGAGLTVYQQGTTSLSGTDAQENQTCSSLVIPSSGSMICAGSSFGSSTNAYGSTNNDNNGNGSNGNTSDILIFKLNSSGSL